MVSKSMCATSTGQNRFVLTEYSVNTTPSGG